MALWALGRSLEPGREVLPWTRCLGGWGAEVALWPKDTPAPPLGGPAPRVAIIREEGSNGDREMADAFHLAGFEVSGVPGGARAGLRPWAF